MKKIGQAEDLGDWRLRSIFEGRERTLMIMNTRIWMPEKQDARLSGLAGSTIVVAVITSPRQPSTPTARAPRYTFS
jgi:hypothetical protein